MNEILIHCNVIEVKGQAACVREKQSLGDNVFGQENLTRFREKLAFEARQLVRSKILTTTWVAGCCAYGLTKDQGSHKIQKVHITDKDVSVRLSENRGIVQATCYTISSCDRITN